jgi:hypothetical protein
MLVESGLRIWRAWDVLIQDEDLAWTTRVCRIRVV